MNHAAKPNGEAEEGIALSIAVDDMVGDLAGVAQSIDGLTVEYRVGSRAFAIVQGDSLDIRLGSDIVGAATRTPDTTASPRGADWVRLTAYELDQHALDRLAAWLTTAWRRAQR